MIRGLNIHTNEIRNALCHYNNKPEVGARARNTVTVLKSTESISMMSTFSEAQICEQCGGR